jgi:hypothetical protein
MAQANKNNKNKSKPIYTQNPNPPNVQCFHLLKSSAHSGNQQRREGNTVFKRQLLNCYHRFLFFYQGQYPPTKHGVMVAESNAQSEHQVWYADSGANACITSNAQNITHLLPFNGGETITVENDTCLLIKSIEFASLQIGQSNFQPSNILHCPYASTNLLSINNFSTFKFNVARPFFIVQMVLQRLSVRKHLLSNGIVSLDILPKLFLVT